MDWLGTTLNASWIVALALALAVVGLAYWEHTASGDPLRLILVRPPWSIPLNLASIIFCLALAAITEALWVRILWIVLGAIWIFQMWHAFQVTRK